MTLAESYEPYGSVLTSTGTASSIFGYAGEQLDTTGLIYLRARYMNPRLGIFLARDPWEGDVLRPGSMNGFNYVEGNPVNAVDPSGKMASACDNFQYPGPSEVYAEGSAAVMTAGFGKWGVWMGVEVAYNLNTLERAVFGVNGFVIQRSTMFSIGRADYVSGGQGIGVKDDGINNGENDLMRDYSGPFINDCASVSVGLKLVAFASGTACPFRAKYGGFSGLSTGVVAGPDFGILPIPVSVSWSELSYWPDRSRYIAFYHSVKMMAKDILTGNESPAQYSPSNVAPALLPFRVAIIARFYDIQMRKGNFYLLQ